MLIHLPIVILTSLHPIAVADAVPQFDIVRECRTEGGTKSNGARTMKCMRATSFKRNGYNLVPARSSSAKEKPASMAPPAMSSCRRASKWNEM
jgi:hypothetical protein